VARRVSVPSADDLFRRTHESGQQVGQQVEGVDAAPGKRAVHAVPDEPTKKKPSGRVKHDEKMTVYVTSEELLELEHARLALRSGHGLAVDRGRLVREALHLVLAELAEQGEDSALVRRLREG
jgi:hypothetical protein